MAILPWNRFLGASEETSKGTFRVWTFGRFKSELPGSFFDLVLSISVLEHVPKEHRNDVIGTCLEFSGPGELLSILLISRDRKRVGRSSSAS